MPDKGHYQALNGVQGLRNQNPYTNRPKPTAFSAFSAGVLMTYFAFANHKPVLFLSLAGLFYFWSAWMYLREYRKKKEKNHDGSAS